jgi:broad specificity phosphatase PhoE
MRKLILIKHAAPQVVPGLAPEKWMLSEQGKHRSSELSQAIAAYAPKIVLASLEPKAAETGEIVAARLGVAFETAPGLHEHDRSNVPHLPSREFISMVELFFRRPGERVLGNESGDEVLERFEKAIDDVIASHPEGNIAIVSHGTVIALWAERHLGGRGFEWWREMELPSFLVVEIPQYRLVEKVARVG